MTAQEVHHEMLCSVIQEEEIDRPALIAATLHNAPLHIGSDMCCSTYRNDTMEMRMMDQGLSPTV